MKDEGRPLRFGFQELILLLSKPNPNAPVKVAKRP